MSVTVWTSQETSTAQHSTLSVHISQRTLADIGSASALGAVLAADIDACDDFVV